MQYQEVAHPYSGWGAADADGAIGWQRAIWWNRNDAGGDISIIDCCQEKIIII